MPAETADYNQSIFCLWSPPIERTDAEQENCTSLGHRLYRFDGSVFRNYTALKERLESLLERNDPIEAEMAYDHLQADIIASFGENEREKLLRKEEQ